MSDKSTRNLPVSGVQLGEYLLGDLLGRGGFSSVFAARDTRLERDVAIKVLHPEVNEADVERLLREFAREINVARRLEHPNIVRLYDFGETDDGLLWMAMEMVRGEELSSVLEREGRLSATRSISIALQALSGLAEAHEGKIVHRDLKPRNIMLARTPTGEDLVKIVDFGIGKALGEHEDKSIHDLTGTNPTSLVGTPRYMAPEQLRNRQVGTYSDVYSMGLVLYELLIGEPAVGGTTTYDVLVKQLKGEIALPGPLDDSPLGIVFRKATTKDPEERYQNALEFYEALASLEIDEELVSRSIEGRNAPPVLAPDEADTIANIPVSRDIPSSRFEQEELDAAAANAADKDKAPSSTLTPLLVLLVIVAIGAVVFFTMVK